MAQSTTNLGKIHVFPSETLYNQFKDIIADNDLALLKDDGAYIVAALLEQNGYVKFSNGLILQWGVSTTSFPLSVSEVYSINASKKDTGANSVPDVQNYSSTGFAYYGPSPYAWFAVCKAQQWGTNQPSPITFPVSFASKCLTVVPQLQASGDSGNMSKIRVCVTDLTARGFALEFPQSTYNYIAIGI